MIICYEKNAQSAQEKASVAPLLGLHQQDSQKRTLGTSLRPVQYRNRSRLHSTLFADRGLSPYRKNAVAYFQFDNVFDGQHCLYNAIYYNNRKDLRNFKKRFKGVRFAIAPDCSECGDVDLLENLYRLKRSRVISLWLTIELGICVIPLITFPSLDFLPFVLEGLKECSVVAFSTKCYINNAEERKILMEAVRITVDTLTLRTIVVYDVCEANEKALALFDYAIQKGIQVVIPDNMLKNRNKQKEVKNAK